MNVELDKIAKTVADRLQRYQLKGRTLTLKIKYSDFKQITRNQSFLHEINDLQTIAQTAKELLLKTSPEDKKIRLLGITLSNFNEIFTHKNTSQLELFQYDD
ncbi:DNA polymerase IV [compost metagenome]